MASARLRLWTCSRCLQAQQRAATGSPRRPPLPAVRSISSTPPRADKPTAGRGGDVPPRPKEQGAMSRRLSEMVEESIDTGSSSDRRTMQSASHNFSDELKAQLEARIADTAIPSRTQKAASVVKMPSYAGKGTSSTAAAPHWDNTESVEDAALRMLDDAHKKLRSTPRPPRIPQNVNLRPQPKSKVSRGVILANARDKTSMYAFSQQEDMSEEEREKFRRELKDRFSPGARPMPQSLQGLTSLANERIENAIARGQFKNIKRGKNVNTERDHNANSPFLDTTEYFMNKIIQKQEIVPPWIEKQQELAKLIDSFRKRLRSDWRRHAARMIASEGGPLEQQMMRARGYALAEEMANPWVQDKQKITGISSDGSIVNITVEDRIAAGVTADNSEPAVKVEVAEPNAESSANDVKALEQELEQEMQAVASLSASSNPAAPPSAAPDASVATDPNSITPISQTPPSHPPRVLPMPTPFRDATWQRTEQAYHTLAVAEINSSTRSYNLMAPKIAQKPYTNLERELKRCFATVAPQLADEIAERARRGTVKGFGDKAEQRARGVLERVVGGGAGVREWRGHEGAIREEGEEKGYGFRQFWRDLFVREEKKKREPA